MIDHYLFDDFMKVLSNLADSHVYSDLFQGLGLFADSLYCSDLFDDEFRSSNSHNLNHFNWYQFGSISRVHVCRK